MGHNNGEPMLARDLVRELRKLPPDMPVEFSIIHSGWLGSMSPLQAFQLEVWNGNGGAAKKPYSKKCKASIYVGEFK